MASIKLDSQNYIDHIKRDPYPEVAIIRLLRQWCFALLSVSMLYIWRAFYGCTKDVM